MGDVPAKPSAAWRARLRLLWHRVFDYPFCAWVFFLTVGFRYFGRRNVPQTGGLLIVVNHQSFFDPPMVGVGTYRPLTYLARKTLFRKRWFARILTFMGAVPLEHEATGTEGLKTALALLKAGRAVVIFPEGTRTRTGQIGPFKPGVVLLIRRAGVPVLPAAFAGNYDVWPPGAKWPRPAPVFGSRRGVTLVFGKPLAPEELKGLATAEVVARLEREVAALHAKAERLRLGDAET